MFEDEFICNYDVTKYGSCMIDDVLFDMLYDNSFEMIFWNYFRFPQKRIVLTVRLRLLTFRYQVSTICWKIFYDSRFEMIYDFHFEMSNAFLFSFWNALWLSFWNEGAKFSYTKLFSSEKTRYFIDENASIITIFVHSFLRKALCPYPCVEINFLRKETVCYVRF